MTFVVLMELACKSPRYEHACDRQTDSQNYDSWYRASMHRAVKITDRLW